jgi:superfamily I DNA/RNA helicase
MAYRVLGQGVACRIIGRDISGGLVRLIEKLKPKGLRGEHGLVEKLVEWRDAEIESLVERGKESKVEGILDKYDTLMTFIEESGVETVPALKEKITGMFNDDKGTDVLTFCTIHRAKGLEADRVFILNPDLMPSPYAKQEWQVIQEHNLMYVAYTRAKDTLAFINSTDIVKEHRQPVGLREHTLPDYPRMAA